VNDVAGLQSGQIEIVAGLRQGGRRSGGARRRLVGQRGRHRRRELVDLRLRLYQRVVA
jgi:hypothetical protein